MSLKIPIETEKKNLITDNIDHAILDPKFIVVLGPYVSSYGP